MSRSIQALPKVQGQGLLRKQQQVPEMDAAKVLRHVRGRFVFIFIVFIFMSRSHQALPKVRGQGLLRKQQQVP